MSCASPLPAPVVISACGVCPQCCSVTASKRTMERIQITMPWNHRMPADGTVWQIKKVTHTVKLGTGASLPNAQYDPLLTYAAGVTVSFGPRLYTSQAAVPIGSAPVTISGPNALWSDAGANPDLYVTLDTDFAFQQWVNKDLVASHALVGGGQNDTDYRVEVMATFKDCDQREIELWDCITVKVLNCN